MISISHPSKAKSKIDPKYLERIVNLIAFPRVYGTDANAQAAVLIGDEFLNIFGERPKYIGEHDNFYCGAAPHEAEILIGAHFDSVPNSPAADDNASAIAVMLACAKELKDNPKICFMAFNCEEYGIAGSQNLVTEHLKTNALKEVHILEMVGYCSHAPNSQKNPLPGLIEVPTVGDFIGVLGNQKQFVDYIITKANEVAVPVIGLSLPPGVPLAKINQISPHLLRSDHVGFWAAGISTVMWTDTAEFRNSNYHQMTDTPDTLDYCFMAEVTQLIVNLYKE